MQSFGLILFSNVKIPAGKLLLTSGRPLISHRKIYLHPITVLIKDLTLLLAQTMAKQLQRPGRGTECSPLEPESKLLSSISEFPSISERRAARDLKGLSVWSILPLKSRQTIPKPCLLLIQPVLILPAALEAPLFLQRISFSLCLLTHSLRKIYFSLADLTLCLWFYMVCPCSGSQSLKSLLVFCLSGRRWEGEAPLRCGSIPDPRQTN